MTPPIGKQLRHQVACSYFEQELYVKWSKQLNWRHDPLTWERKKKKKWKVVAGSIYQHVLKGFQGRTSAERLLASCYYAPPHVHVYLSLYKALTQSLSSSSFLFSPCGCVWREPTGWVTQRHKYLSTHECIDTHTHTRVIAYSSHSFYILLHHQPVVVSRLVPSSVRHHLFFFLLKSIPWFPHQDLLPFI